MEYQKPPTKRSNAAVKIGDGLVQHGAALLRLRAPRWRSRQLDPAAIFTTCASANLPHTKNNGQACLKGVPGRFACSEEAFKKPSNTYSAPPIE